jgi:hypothetical protein
MLSFLGEKMDGEPLLARRMKFYFYLFRIIFKFYTQIGNNETIDLVHSLYEWVEF